MACKFNLCCFRSFVGDYSFLFDFRSTNIFVDNVFDRVPEEWFECFDEYHFEELDHLLQLKPQSFWPLSLRQFVRRCASLQLFCEHRRPAPHLDQNSPSEGALCSLCGAAHNADEQSFVDVLVACVGCDATSTTADVTPLSSLLAEFVTNASCSSRVSACAPETHQLNAKMARGVSRKKRHELSRLTASLVCLCDRLPDIAGVLDIGAGLGYVGECVRAHCRLPCVGVDNRRSCVVSAAARRGRLAFCRHCLPHTLLSIDKQCDARQLQHTAISAVRQATSDCRCYPALRRTGVADAWCWTALHACGALATHVARMFACGEEQQHARALLLLACCYHKTPGEERVEEQAAEDRGREDAGPGTSGTVNVAGVLLSITALRVASERSAQALCRLSTNERRRHARAATWRAAVELVVQRAAVRGRQVSVCRRRRRNVERYGGFSQYAIDMLAGSQSGLPDSPSHLLLRDIHFVGQQMGISPDQSDEELYDQTINNNHPDLDPDRQCTGDVEWRIHVLLALQSCCQMVLETLVLLDRVRLVREQNELLYTAMVKMFDERVSPRCWALLAVKR